MQSPLENARVAHEEIERIERGMVAAMLQDTKSHKDNIDQVHRVSNMVERVQDRSGHILSLYEDKNGEWKDEIESLGGAGNVFSAFYERLRGVKEFYRRFPHELAEDMVVDCSVVNPVQFSGEEKFGRFLDLHDFYMRYINMKQFQRCNYLRFLNKFTDFHLVARAAKTPEYTQYLQDLHDYMLDFFKRVEPLFDFENLEQEMVSDFKKLWKEGKISGWSDESTPSVPLYCKPCDKKFAKQTVFDSHLTGKKHMRAAARYGSEESQGVALLEQKVLRLSELLAEQITNTRGEVERKQARNAEEILAELEEEEEIVEEESSDSEVEMLYNPLNLPLGWDGKPIPYWLYKLHGLNIKYECEICGNTAYWGRRAFERHFQEWRHAHGMRCLKIPNTREFHEITLMEDAKKLWAKIQAETAGMEWRPELEEEYEDSAGNVFNKKTYDDLARQGLL